jgi:alanine racemase
MDSKATELFPEGKNFPVHIEIDTGMHLTGFTMEETDDLLNALKQLKRLKVASVFSHFAASDLEEFDDYTSLQYQQFNHVCEKISRVLSYPFLRHISNSAGIIRHPEFHEDMVRLGIGMYGTDPVLSPKGALRQVVSFTSVVSQVKRIKPGETVGYNRAGIVKKEMEIAIVPVGYADGLRRSLVQNNGYLLVKGVKAPFIGNISMDMCALNVTGLDVKAGDPVVVFSPERTVEEFADQMDTIPYEVLTSVAARVKRVYFQE